MVPNLNSEKRTLTQTHKSENGLIVQQFDKDEPIEPFKYDFGTAAKLDKQEKSVEKCEL